MFENRIRSVRLETHKIRLKIIFQKIFSARHEILHKVDYKVTTWNH